MQKMFFENLDFNGEIAQKTFEFIAIEKTSLFLILNNLSKKFLKNCDFLNFIRIKSEISQFGAW